MKKNHFHNPNKGPRAVHQNRTKFDPNKHFEIKIDPHILANKSSLCCWRCSSIIQWKVDYAKYRELERSGKCNVCHQRTVGLPFHRICQACALENALCAKCQKPAHKLHEQALLAFEKQRYLAAKKERRLRGEDVGSDSEDFSSEDEDSDSEDETMDPEEAGAKLVIPMDDEEKKKRGLEGIEIEEEDEDFQHLLGLNVGRLKREKRQRQKEAEEIDRINMRERERRTAMRQIRKAKEAEAAAGKMDFDSDDSDEEM